MKFNLNSAKVVLLVAWIVCGGVSIAIADPNPVYWMMFVTVILL